jgi:protein gp37
MADVFDEEAPVGEREKLWRVIAQTPQLDWQILTKRPQLIAQSLPQDWEDGYPNVWLGTSVEDERVVHRVYDLVTVPAAVHFLSVEPLIGPIGVLPLEDIEWVIVGGESGPKSRPMKEEWVESIYSQCRIAEVPFFFKQWGGVRKHQTGRTLHSRTYDEMPHICETADVLNKVLSAA